MQQNVEEVEVIFENARADCPEEIRYSLFEWESWMTHHFNQMLANRSISNSEFCQLVNMVCSF